MPVLPLMLQRDASLNEGIPASLRGFSSGTSLMLQGTWSRFGFASDGRQFTVYVYML